MKITHIELDYRVFRKPVIKIWSENRVVRTYKPHPDKAYDLFSEINRKWMKSKKK